MVLVGNLYFFGGFLDESDGETALDRFPKIRGIKSKGLLIWKLLGKNGRDAEIKFN